MFPLFLVGVPTDAACIKETERHCVRGEPIRHRSAPQVNYHDEYDSDPIYEVRTARHVFPIRMTKCCRVGNESPVEDNTDSESHLDDGFQTEDDESHIDEF